MIWLPTVENVLLLHQKLIDRSGGSAGVRDLGLIESALARAEAAFGGVEAHQGTIRKAAAVGCGLTRCLRNRCRALTDVRVFDTYSVGARLFLRAVV